MIGRTGCRRSNHRPAALWWVATLAALCVDSPEPVASAGSDAPAAPIPRVSTGIPPADVLALADSLVRRGDAPAAVAALDRFLLRPRSESAPPLRRRVLLRRARILALTGHPARAIASGREALAAAEAAGDSAHMAEGLRWTAYGMGLLGRAPEAAALWSRLERLARARGDREHQGYAHFGLGYAAELARDLPRAQREHARAVELFRSLDLAPFDQWALSAHAGVCAGAGDVVGARGSYGQVVALARRRNDANGEWAALNDLGSLEFRSGDPGVAVRHFEEACDAGRRAGTGAAAIVPLRNLAMALTYLGHLDVAAGKLELGLAESARGGLVTERSELLEQLGYVRSQQVRLHDAARAFRQSMALDDSLGRSDNAGATLGLVMTLNAMDSAGAGLEVLATRLEARRERLSPLDCMLLDRLWGEGLELLGRHTEALARVEAAGRQAAQLGVEGRQWAMRVTAARCARALGRPDQALAQLERAAIDWELERARQREPEWRERLADVRRELYTELIDLLLDHPASLPESERVRRAFAAAQRFKGRTLYERAHGRDIQPLSPQAYATIGLDSLRRTVLEPGEAFVDAYLGVHRAALFVVLPETVIVRRLSIDTIGLRPRLERIRSLLATSPSGTVPDAGRRQVLAAAALGLTRDLLGEAATPLARSRRILLCPDGPLAAVPADLWFPEWLGSTPVSSAREQVRVPSATLLAEQRSVRTGSGATVAPAPTPARGALLVLSSGVGPMGTTLRGAEREARRLAARFVTVPAESLIRMAASPAPVAGPWVSGCAAVHVTAHAGIDDQRPWRSGIYLPSFAARLGDSLLRADRIAGLRLPVSLVVLSSCETAGQRTPSGEGMLGLSSAFLASGAGAVVATLWPVSDRATAELVELLYDRLARGETVAAALRGARVALAARDRTRDPFYWAGFVLIGDGDVRVELRRRGNPWIAGGLAGGLGGLAALAFARRRSRVTEPGAETPST